MDSIHWCDLEGGIATPQHAWDQVQYQSGEQKAWQDRLSAGLDEHLTRESYFVKLRDDGSFLISGVPAGKYRFLIKLYEPPTGCLVEPVGYGFLEFSTDDYTAVDHQLDLGTLEVPLKPIPKVGETLPDFRYQDAEGQPHQLSEWRGQHVMIDFWASWCEPCIRVFPELAEIHQSLEGDPRATLIGISVDKDLADARTVALRHEISWPVGYAGDISGAGNTARTLGISTVPTYLVLDPMGKILYRGFNHEAAAQVLRDALQ